MIVAQLLALERGFCGWTRGGSGQIRTVVIRPKERVFRLQSCLFFKLFVFMRTVAALALLAPSLLLMGQENWPQFRGPNSSGIAASGAAYPVEFGPMRRVLWKQALPEGH